MRLLWLLGVILLAAVAAQGVSHVPGLAGYQRFVGLGVLGAMAYFAAAWLVLRGVPAKGSLGVILVVAALLRVGPLASPAFLSTDLYRYIWDGRVQDAGINPYRYIPSAPELAPLRDAAVFPLINRSDYAPTIYPPAAQAIFAAIAATWPEPAGVKATMLGFEAIAVIVMLRLLRLARLPTERVLLYAWQPLWPWEYAGNGHIDAAAIAFIGLALLATAGRREGWAGVALSAAVMVKLLPAVLAPALWRWRGWRMPAACLACVVAGYAAYASVGLGMFGFLGGYAREEGLGSGGGILAIQLAALVTDPPRWAGAAWLALAALAMAGLSLTFRDTAPDPAERLRRIGADALLLGTITTVALTPHYAWYFGWLAYLACLAPFRSVLWLTAACVLLYLDPVHTSLGWSSLIYAPFLLLAIRDRRRPALA